MVKDQERPATRQAVESDETCPAAVVAMSVMVDSASSSCDSSPRNSGVRGGFPRSDSADSQGPHTPSEESFSSSGGSSEESITGLPFHLDDVDRRGGGGGGGGREPAPVPRQFRHNLPQLFIARGRRAQEYLDPSDDSRSMTPTDADEGGSGHDFDGDYQQLLGQLNINKSGGRPANVAAASRAPARGAGVPARSPPDSPLSLEGDRGDVDGAAVARVDAAPAAMEGVVPPADQCLAQRELRWMSQTSLRRYCQDTRNDVGGLDESPVACTGQPDFFPAYQHVQHQEQQYQQQYQQPQHYQQQLYNHYRMQQHVQQQQQQQQQHQQQQLYLQQQQQQHHLHHQQYPGHYNHQQFHVSPHNSQPASPQHAPPGIVVDGGGGVCSSRTASDGGGGPLGAADVRAPFSRQSSLGLSRLEPPGPLVSHAEAGAVQAMRGCAERNWHPGPAEGEAFSPGAPPACSPGGTRTQSIVLPDRQRKIFVTYSLDNDAHIGKVISFVTWLRKNGFYTEMDMFDTLLQGMSKIEWMDRFLDDKDYLIVVIISPKYKRDTETPAGSDEHGLHTHYIHQQMKNEYIQNGSKNFRLVPVLFPDATKGHVPSWLNNTIVYPWPGKQADLMLRLCRREKYEIPPPGPLPVIVAQPFGSK
ncbi:uncharacterized protein LOC116953411 [Petromyzon marinus]|uniref:AF4/FMR2 family member 4-like n=1 Tax=Petromyzon marinus TaxID=7757 RepID=A0AAJ7U6D6_PETMA|nr:AF4/FMR2 family member 4-like [Petromyzon marinus]